MKFKDKTAIVTGATKGIGRGIADALAGEGANIVVVSRTSEDCQRVAKEIADVHGVRALACKTDVTDLSALEYLMEETTGAFGRIDILINNAGTAITKKAEDITEEDWDRVMNVDLKAVFFCAQAAGKRMIKQNSGKIVNIASMFGLVGDKQILPYCVAKGGVLQTTRALALEWARHNIQVNALCPGYVITKMNETELTDERFSSVILKRIAMRRYACVDEIADACIFLASDGSNYMTGQSIVIDGGWTCQ